MQIISKKILSLHHQTIRTGDNGKQRLNIMGTIIQNLNLKVGQKATCTAGYPHSGTITVQCIKDFSEAKESDDIVNNPNTYIKVVDQGRFGALTSHYISSNWYKMREYVNHEHFGRGYIVSEKLLTENKLGRMLHVQFENDCIWVDEINISYEN